MATLIQEPPEHQSTSKPTHLRKLSREERRQLAKSGAEMTAAAWLDCPDDLVADLFDEVDEIDA